MFSRRTSGRSDDFRMDEAAVYSYQKKRVDPEMRQRVLANDGWRMSVLIVSRGVKLGGDNVRQFVCPSTVPAPPEVALVLPNVQIAIGEDASRLILVQKRSPTFKEVPPPPVQILPITHGIHTDDTTGDHPIASGPKAIQWRIDEMAKVTQLVIPPTWYSSYFCPRRIRK